MKKKNIMKVFFKSLLKSLLSIAIVLGVGVISYKVSYAVLSEDSTVEITSDSLQDILDEATTDEISKNLIYVYDDDTDKITHVMLEICNTNTYNMDYVTIPVKTDYTIPSVMYRKLCQINAEIPQVIRVSKLKQYFEDESDAYGYGVLIFEKMLGTDISYYTAISSEVYKNHYESQKVTVAYEESASSTDTTDTDSTESTEESTAETTALVTTPMKISVASDSYKAQLADLNGDEETIAEYIKEQYERNGVTSNLTVYNKIGYIEAYQQMEAAYYHYWGIPGSYTNRIFTVDTKAAKKALKYLAENTETYAQEQDLTILNQIGVSGDSADSDASTAVSSYGLKIYVLNGSRIAGLASATKERLESAGYTVPEVGNYEEEILTTTRIVVSEENQGHDLAAFFNDPEIVVGDVTEGYDIEIIVGTVDANS